jgi:hypothetical protein
MQRGSKERSFLIGKVVQPESEIVFQQYALKLDDLQSVLAIRWEGANGSKQSPLDSCIFFPFNGLGSRQLAEDFLIMEEVKMYHSGM